MAAGERRRPVGCPSNLALDEMLAGDLTAGPAHASLLEHVEHCLTCRERLVARRADPILEPDPARFRPLLVSRATQPPRRRLRWMGLGVALAGAVAASFMLWAHGAGPGDGVAADRTKGALALTVHIKRRGPAGGAETIDSVNGQGRLRAGEEMRFSVAAARPGYAVVLGLDAAPSVTIYVPAAGSAQRPTPVEATRPATLPGSVIADETSGFERIVAFVCQNETPPETLRRKAEAALALAGGRPEGVSSLGTGCLETSVLLRKESR
jgi:Domain of unknown function (DUF4384)